MATMNALSSIGVNPSGFSKLLCSRFYAQIVRPQMEYGIAINCFNHTQLKTLEEAQNKCIRKIYGASGNTSTKVMLHLAKLPTMKERIAILQAQFLFRSLSLPEDTLLYLLMPHIQYTRGHQWYRLSKTALWRLMPPTIADLDARGFRAIKKNFLHSNLEKQIQGKNSKLLSSCRPTITLDPILWLPMTHEERSRCLRWRLGWLPGGAPKPCPRHPNNNLSRRHAISCLNTHRRLCMPETIADPISFLLNMLPTHAFVSTTRLISQLALLLIIFMSAWALIKISRILKIYIFTAHSLIVPFCIVTLWQDNRPLDQVCSELILFILHTQHYKNKLWINPIV